jgi:aminopeptidase
LTPDDRLQRYAELVVRVGANVQPGRRPSCSVRSSTSTPRAIAREAYRAGARRVIVNYSDLHLRRAAIELGPGEMLGQSPPHILDWCAAGATRARR